MIKIRNKRVGNNVQSDIIQETEEQRLKLKMYTGRLPRAVIAGNWKADNEERRGRLLESWKEVKITSGNRGTS